MSGAYLGIVTYRRPDELRETLRGWRESHDFAMIEVLDNGGEVATRAVCEAAGATYVPSARPAWLLGSLAESWNLLLMRGLMLRHRWVVLSQDDVDVRPHWAETVWESPHSLYFGPKGDAVHLHTWDSFSRIGWFDERFRTIHYQESDYILRALRACPELVSVVDMHPWELQHNDVGLQHHWLQAGRTGHVMETGDEMSRPFAMSQRLQWEAKWSHHPWHAFRNGLWRKVEKFQPDVDWYPSATRRLEELWGERAVFEGRHPALG